MYDEAHTDMSIQSGNRKVIENGMMDVLTFASNKIKLFLLWVEDELYANINIT